MKRKTYKQLIQFIKQGDFDRGYVSSSLFKIYNEIEQFSPEQMIDYIKDFFKFAFKSKTQNKILKCTKNSLNYARCDLDDDYLELKGALADFFNESTKIKNKQYVDIVKLCLSDKHKNILDVGAGAIPYSSMLLANNSNNVYAMDRFILSDQVMQKQGVKQIEGFFDQNTNINDFDIVIGRKPCDAIKAIAINCSKRVKPFFMELCHCSFYRESRGENGKRYFDWDELFYDINPKIQVYKNYAYLTKTGKDSYIEQAIDYCAPNYIAYEEALSEIFKDISECLKEDTFVNMNNGKRIRFADLSKIIINNSEWDL